MGLFLYLDNQNKKAKERRNFKEREKFGFETQEDYEERMASDKEIYSEINKEKIVKNLKSIGGYSLWILFGVPFALLFWVVVLYYGIKWGIILYWKFLVSVFSSLLGG